MWSVKESVQENRDNHVEEKAKDIHGSRSTGRVNSAYRPPFHSLLT